MHSVSIHAPRSISHSRRLHELSHVESIGVIRYMPMSVYMNQYWLRITSIKGMDTISKTIPTDV